MATTCHKQTTAKRHRRAKDAARHVWIFAWKMNFLKKQRETFAIVQRLPKQIMYFEKISRHCVRIFECQNRCKTSHDCNILASKRANNNCALQLKQREKSLNFTYTLVWYCFRFIVVGRTQNRNHVFFDQNPDYTSQNTDQKLSQNEGVIFCKRLTKFGEHRIICCCEIASRMKVEN